MSFTLFPNLSQEIRLKIWRYALPGPRIIKLSTDPVLKNLVMQASNSSTLTSLYHTSKEAHAAVRQQYGLYFRRRLGFAKLAILFNPDVDILHISDPQTLEKFYNEGLHLHPTHVKSLALYLPLKRTDLGFIFDLKTHSKTYYRVLKAMVGLKKVIFVDANSDANGREEIDDQEVELMSRDLRAVVGNAEKCDFGHGYDPSLLKGVQFEVVDGTEFGS